jgi:hypothetical protein
MKYLLAASRIETYYPFSGAKIHSLKPAELSPERSATMGVGVAEEEAIQYSARRKPRNSSYLTSRFGALSSNGLAALPARYLSEMVDNSGLLI